MTLVDTGEQTHDRRPAEARARYLGRRGLLLDLRRRRRDVDIGGAGALSQPHRASWRRSPRSSRRAASARSTCKAITVWQAFVEKPQGDGAWINGGFFVLSAEVLDYIEGDDTIWEREPLERLAADGQLWRLLSTAASGSRWTRCATRHLLEELWQSGKAPVESLVMNRAFWQGRRVLVTGHTGFKGGWLALWLQALGAKVTGFALPPPTKPTLFDVGARAPSGMDLDHRRSARSRSRWLRRVARSATRRSCCTSRRSRWCGSPMRDPVETYAHQRDGHGPPARSGARACRACAPWSSSPATSATRTANGSGATARTTPMGGHRPVQQQQGLRRTGDRGLPQLVLPPARHAEHGVAHRHGARRQRDRRRRLGGRPPGARLLARDRRGRRRLASAIPTPCAPGSTCSSRSSGYLVLAERLHVDGAAFAEAWNFGPADEDAQPVRWVVERMARSAGAAVRSRGSSNRSRSRTRRITSSSTARKRAPGWAGVPRWPLARRAREDRARGTRRSALAARHARVHARADRRIRGATIRVNRNLMTTARTSCGSGSASWSREYAGTGLRAGAVRPGRNADSALGQGDRRRPNCTTWSRRRSTVG